MIEYHPEIERRFLLHSTPYNSVNFDSPHHIDQYYFRRDYSFRIRKITEPKTKIETYYRTHKKLIKIDDEDIPGEYEEIISREEFELLLPATSLHIAKTRQNWITNGCLVSFDFIDKYKLHILEVETPSKTIDIDPILKAVRNVSLEITHIPQLSNKNLATIYRLDPDK